LSGAEENSAAPIAPKHAESQRMSVDWCGWGPGGRRFKSCLPDLTKALVILGFCRSGNCSSRRDGEQTGINFRGNSLWRRRRSHGSGHLHVKWGAYYVRWRTPNSRLRNRRVGNVRTRGEKEGLTRRDAEREARRIIEAENDQPPVEPAEPPPTVREAPTVVAPYRLALRSSHGASDASAGR